MMSRRLRTLPFAICMVVIVLVSCRPKYFYGIGFKSCADGLIRMNVRSATYSTQLPVPLRKGQIKEEDAITVPPPSSMELTWYMEGQPPQSATYDVSGRLPNDFNVGRDTLWFVACPNVRPMLIAEIGSTHEPGRLERLADGRRWNGSSIYEACNVCDGNASALPPSPRHVR